MDKILIKVYTHYLVARNLTEREGNNKEGLGVYLSGATAKVLGEDTQVTVILQNFYTSNYPHVGPNLVIEVIVCSEEKKESGVLKDLARELEVSLKNFTRLENVTWMVSTANIFVFQISSGECLII